jgi:pSer/pThr/pTyr-binding forkhead associated (FHA) protein/CheY-like chemotaxis protein
MTPRAELHLNTDGTERVVVIEAPKFTIGRGVKNSLYMPDSGVSRYHAELIRLGKDFLLRDLGSTNGSFVNDERISEHLLMDGDLLRFGSGGPEVIFRIINLGAPTGERAARQPSTTESLVESLSRKLSHSPEDMREEVELRCMLAEPYLTRGQHQKAFDVLSKYTQDDVILKLLPQSRAQALYWLGRVYIELKQYSEAIGALRASLNLYDQLANDTDVAAVQAALGRALIGVDEWFIARDNLHRALLAARRAGNSRLRVDIHLLLGKLDWKEADYEGARYNWSRAARLSEDVTDSLLLARVALQQAFILFAEGKMKEAVTAYQEVSDQIEKIGNIPLLLKAYSSLSRVLTRLGSWTATERLLEHRLLLARENSLWKAEAVALTDLAELRYLQGKLNAAWNVIRSAVERHGERIYPRTQRILGKILSARNDHEIAIEEYRKGLECAIRKGALEEQIIIGLELAVAHLDLGQREEARRQLEAVESASMLDPALGLMGRALYTRGLVHQAFNQMAEANRSFTQSLSAFSTVGDPYRVALVHTAIGQLRSRMGRMASARAHLEEAKEIFAKLGAATELGRIEIQLASGLYDNIAPAMTRTLPPGLNVAAPLSMSFSATSIFETVVAEEKPHRILIAEADEDLASVLMRGLEAENYLVDRVQDGQVAIERAVSSDYHYDVFVLDALLEHRSGFDVCRDLRKANLDMPVILIGHRQGVEDKIEALGAGADDFISKRNMVFEELLAKMEALLR